MAACKDRPNTVIIANLRRKAAAAQGGDGDFFVACYHMYVCVCVWDFGVSVVNVLLIT